MPFMSAFFDLFSGFWRHKWRSRSKGGVRKRRPRRGMLYFDNLSLLSLLLRPALPIPIEMCAADLTVKCRRQALAPLQKSSRQESIKREVEDNKGLLAVEAQCWQCHQRCVMPNWRRTDANVWLPQGLFQGTADRSQLAGECVRFAPSIKEFPINQGELHPADQPSLISTMKISKENVEENLLTTRYRCCAEVAKF